MLTNSAFFKTLFCGYVNDCSFRYYLTLSHTHTHFLYTALIANSKCHQHYITTKYTLKEILDKYCSLSNCKGLTKTLNINYKSYVNTFQYFYATYLTFSYVLP